MKIAFVFLHGRLTRMGGVSDEFQPTEVKGDNIPRPSEFFLGALEIQENGHDVYVFELADNYSASTFVEISQKILKNRWFPVKTSVGTIARAKSLIKRLNSFDVIVATTVGISYSLGFWKSTGILKPQIVSIQCGLFNYENTPLRKIATRWLLSDMWVQLYGEGELADYQEIFDLPDNRIEVNLFGVDTRFWNHKHTDFSEDYILSVGNDSNRDFNLLVEAAGALECNVKILTKRDIITSLPDNVEILKGSWKSQELSDTELRCLYQNARAVVVPLKETLQPSGQSVALQAMACEKPVVITRTKGLWSDAHLFDWENVIFIAPGDVQQLIAVLKKLLSDKPLSEEIGKRAREYAVSHGNIYEFSKRLEQCCERSLSS